MGHAFPEATVRFEGDEHEGERAFHLLLDAGLRPFRLRRSWGSEGDGLGAPWWEITLLTTTPCWWLTSTGSR